MTDKPKPEAAPPLDQKLIEAAIAQNWSRMLADNAGSTGFQTNDLRYRRLIDPRSPRIAEEFLVNSRLLRHERESETSARSYFSDASAVMLSLLGQEEEPELRSIALPKSVQLPMALDEAIARRRSVRSYTGDRMPLEFLATVLRGAAGITGQADAPLRQGGHVTFQFRSAPSGGGLYPVELYVAAQHVRGLERGIYRYAPVNDCLRQRAESEALETLLGCFSMPEEFISVEKAGAILLLVGQPWRSMRKYGARGVRYMFLEAGAITQNIHLSVAALGFASVDCASIYDDEAHEVLQLDGLYQTLLHTVILGYAG